MTTWPKYNQTVSSSALPSRLPAGLRQLGAPQWMFPTDALWKCLSFGCIYYILIRAHWMKWWHIADRSNFRGWYMWSGAGPVLKNRRDEKKSHLISSQGTVLSSHMLVYDDAAQGHARGLLQERFPKLLSEVLLVRLFHVHQTLRRLVSFPPDTRWDN